MSSINHGIDHQVARLGKLYKKEIASLACIRDSNEYYELLYGLSDLFKFKGYNYILPFYYILNKDCNMAWILLNYTNISFLARPDLFPDYHSFAKSDMESPTIWDMKPLSYEENEEKELLPKYGTTCFRLTNDYYPKAIKEMQAGSDEQEIFDISPEARYRTVDKRKNYYLSHDAFYETSRLMEIYFRQEKIAETEECLFRLRHIASAGEPPKYLIEHPTSKHISAWVNMYDYWYQARRESDPVRRKELAWNAFYWFLENGFRLIGSMKIDTFVHFSDGCEIIGEFELMGEDNENFLRHLKRFVMHASVSFCKKMMDNPIEIIPFSERNMPNYEESQEIMMKIFKKYNPD